MAELGRHFLIKSFSDYYQELAAARWAIAQGRLVEYLNLPLSQERPANELLVSLLFKKLKSTLSAQQENILAQATLDEKTDYLVVLYVLTGLTDEQLLLDTDWELASLWQNNLLETAFFGTAQAGTRFYRRLKEVLNERSKASNRAALAAVFLMALSLGFRGRYRSVNGEQKIQRLRIALYRKLNTKAKTEYLFSQAYQHGLREVEDPARHRVSSLSRWYKFGGLAFAIYLLLSSAVWITASSALTETISALKCGEVRNETVDGPECGQGCTSLSGDECSPASLSAQQATALGHRGKG